MLSQLENSNDKEVLVEEDNQQVWGSFTQQGNFLMILGPLKNWVLKGDSLEKALLFKVSVMSDTGLLSFSSKLVQDLSGLLRLEEVFTMLKESILIT